MEEQDQLKQNYGLGDSQEGGHAFRGLAGALQTAQVCRASDPRPTRAASSSKTPSLQVISKCLSKHSKNVFPPPQSFLSHLNILCVLYFKELLLKKKALVWKLLIAGFSICFLFCKKPLVTEISLYFSWKREKTWQLRLCLPSFLKACITFIREKRN